MQNKTIQEMTKVFLIEKKYVNSLLDQIDSCLKREGISYKELANDIKVKEHVVRNIFSRQAGITMTDIAIILEDLGLKISIEKEQNAKENTHKERGLQSTFQTASI